jgi:hypothetical protein
MSLNQVIKLIREKQKFPPQWKSLSDGKREKELNVNIDNAESKQFKIRNKHTDRDINLDHKHLRRGLSHSNSIPIKMSTLYIQKAAASYII